MEVVQHNSDDESIGIEEFEPEDFRPDPEGNEVLAAIIQDHDPNHYRGVSDNFIESKVDIDTEAFGNWLIHSDEILQRREAVFRLEKVAIHNVDNYIESGRIFIYFFTALMESREETNRFAGLKTTKKAVTIALHDII